MVSADVDVSIILPTHNRAGELPRAMRSVLGQSHAGLELIVIDDASTDDTARVVADFGDRRVRYLRHEQRRGAAAARNTGLCAAGAPFIAFQDSDDEWLPDKLTRQLRRFAADPRLGAVYGGALLVGPDGRERLLPARPAAASGNVRRALLWGSFIALPTLVIRRPCLDAAGHFDERLPRFQDWELLLRLSRVCTVGFVDEPLLRCHAGPDRITAGHDQALVEAERLILEKHHDAFAEAGADVLAHRFWHLGHVCCMRAEMRAGRRAFRTALGLRFRPLYAVTLALALSARLYGLTYGIWASRRAVP